MSKANMPKLSTYSDCEVGKALYGNLEGLGLFYEKVTRDISRNLSKDTPSYEAEELALEVIEKMCRHLGDAKFRDHPGNYTKRIIFGTIIDYWRSARAKKRSSCDEQRSGSNDSKELIFSFQFSGRRQWLSIEELDLLGEEPMEPLHSAPHDVEVEQEELRSIFDSLLDELGDCGKALRYRYFEARSYTEIAELMHKEVNTIKTLLHRGKDSLRIELKKAGYTEHDLNDAENNDRKVKK